MVFQTRMGLMLGKLRLGGIKPYWIIKFNGLYQLGTLAGEVFDKWVNGFRLKPYRGLTPTNPFEPGERTDSQPTTLVMIGGP